MVGFQTHLNKAEAMRSDIANGNAIELLQNSISMMQIQSNKIVIDGQVANFIRDNIGVAVARLRVLFSEQWPQKKKHNYIPNVADYNWCESGNRSRFWFKL